MPSFCEDIYAGLCATPKQLQSKYFYDEKGDELFRKIMTAPEYYITNCEMEILSEQTTDIIDACFKLVKTFNIIELGCGDGAKTKYLLKKLVEKNIDSIFIPIDISANALQIIEKSLKQEIPSMKVIGLNGDYFEMLPKANVVNGHIRSKLVLLLGSNIGNMLPEESLDFLRKIFDHLDDGDLLFVGFDLKKNPKNILAAYNDVAGITKDFNLNLLQRINTELGANFNLDKFDHFPVYNPISGACKSFLISLEEQEVKIKRCKSSFHFLKDEAIQMEISQKFSMDMINNFAQRVGFKAIREFFDSKRWFVDVLWQK